MIAIISGKIKNIAICLNRALFNCLSVAPILLSIVYLVILSALSDSSFNASKAALEIKKMIPKYNPINVIMAPSPTLAS